MYAFGLKHVWNDKLLNNHWKASFENNFSALASKLLII